MNGLRTLFCVGFLAALVSAIPYSLEWSKYVKERERQLVATGEVGTFGGLRTSDQIQRVVEILDYHVTIEPYFPYPGISGKKDFTFDGTVVIEFKVTNKTDFVYLRAENLKFLDKSLTKDSKVEKITQFTETGRNNELKFKSENPFQVGGVYVLTIKYSGRINRDVGLYYNGFNNKGTTDYVVATFLETINARQLLPCFDDPWFKAPFTVSLIHPKKAKVFANTYEQTKKTWSSDKDITTFKPSPRMSSYLLAFAIGDFTVGSAKSKSGVEVRIQSLPGRDHSVKYWAEMGAKCVDAMEDLTGVRFALPKLDNVDMLSMGFAGAMENWGMIVYGGYLAGHPTWGYPSQLHSGLITACHETAHQWFGDLVTADRWGLEFLHESFAAFFQYRTLRWIYEDKENAEAAFIRGRGISSAKWTNHALITKMSNFDSVTYASGSGILRMINTVMGDKNFHLALNNYLRGNSYKNADEWSLIRSFEVGLDHKPLCGSLKVDQFVIDYFTKVHYPIVNIGHDGNKHTFVQSVVGGDRSARWNVPLFVLDAETETNHLIWLLKDGNLCTNGFELDGTKPYIFHWNGGTFGRIRYSVQYYEKILEEVYFKNVDALTVLAMLDDQQEYQQENSEQRSKNFYTKVLKNHVEHSDGFTLPSLVQAYIGSQPDRALLDRIGKRLNFKKGQTERDIGFINILGLDAVRRNLGNARADALQAFKEFQAACKDLKNLSECNKVAIDARPAVYCAGSIGQKPDQIKFLEDYAKAVVQEPAGATESYRISGVRSCRNI